MTQDRFTQVDFSSPPGQQLRAKLESRLASLREELEGHAIGEARTQQVRGGISVIKEMLAEAAPVVRAPTYGSIKRTIIGG